MDGHGRNLRKLFAKADAKDIADGCDAYSNYHEVVGAFAEYYGFPFERTLAAFVALSPSSDYFGNLRSLASVLGGIKSGVPMLDITVSTFKHCRDRAYSYATGDVDFLSTAKGPKIRSFYKNIFDPLDPVPVTVDGHMSAAWQGRALTMKEAVIRPRFYETIADSIRRVAATEGYIPNQMQAILWLTRKRVLRIKFEAQFDLFSDAMMVDPIDAQPYPRGKT